MKMKSKQKEIKETPEVNTIELAVPSANRKLLLIVKSDTSNAGSDSTHPQAFHYLESPDMKNHNC